MKKTIGLAATISLFIGGSVGAAHAMGKTISQSATAGPYRLNLVIGPAESMHMKGSKGSGETMLGGRNSNCSMSHMSGMGTGSHGCNHHVEVHVLKASSGGVIRNARISVRLVDTKSRKSVTVPIMTMQGSSGSRDFHYGNNVYAPSGRYRVIVHVGTASRTFEVALH